MADNQMVKIVFDFDLGNVPASAKKLSQYLKDNNLDLKFTKQSVDNATASLNQFSTAQIKAGNAAAAAGNSVKKSNMQWTNLALVVQDLPYGFRGIQNNLPALMGGIAGMAGPLYLVGSAVIALFTAWDAGLFKVKDATNALKDAQKEYNDTLKSSMGSAGEEIAKMNALVSIAGNHEITMQKRLSAVKKLQDEYPSYFGNLDKEKILNGDVATATDGVKTAIIERAKATAVASKINKLAAEKFAKDEELYQLALQKTARVQAAVNFVKQFPSSAKHLKGLIDASVGGIRDQENAIKSFVDSIDKELNRLQGIYTTAETGSIGLENNKGGKKGKTPEEVAKEKARLAKIANEAETQAYINTLDERAQKEYKAGLELSDGLEKMRAAGYTNSETYYAAYRQNMLNIAKEYDDKAAKEKERRDKEASDAANKINDRDLQNSLTALKIESDVATKIANASGKTTSTDRIKILEDYKNKLYDLASTGGYTAEQFDKIADALINVDAAIAGSKDKVKSFNVTWTDTINGINSTINDFINNSLYALGESIGKVLAGENVDAIDVFGTLIADALQSLGKQLIAFGVAKLAAWESLKNPTPAGAALAVAAGIAAVAAGAALKSSLTNAKSTTSGNTNSKNSNMPRKFADGGIISGPTYGLMGEYPGAKSNPEVVAPLDKLKDMMGGGGGGTFMLRGQDLLLSVNRAQKASNLKGQNISLA